MPDETTKTESRTEIAEGLPPGSPIVDDHDALAEPDVRAKEPTAMQVFFAWERLRIPYNLILCIGLIEKYSIWNGVGDMWMWDFSIFLFCINACLSIGPVAEGYSCLFHVPRSVARWISFLAITAGSLGLLSIWR